MELHGKEGHIYDQETGKTVAMIPYFDATDSNHLWLQEILAKAPEMYEMLKDIAETGSVEVYKIENLIYDIHEATAGCCNLSE